MQISNINLTNFRNYREYLLEFEPMTILIGPNGVGKTNLLESVYMLATTSSYRTKSNRDLVLYGKNYSKITGLINNDTVELFIDLEKYFKKYRINKVEKRNIEALGKLIVVLFVPESLDIINGSPGLRRRFMNYILAQINRQYAISLIELNKVLANRNRLLYMIKSNLAKEEELDFWDQELVKLNKIIAPLRSELISIISTTIGDHYKQISASQDQFNVKYQMRACPDDLLELIKDNRQAEIRQSTTLYGPHRDELEFCLNNRPISSGWSRGELRSATLALKMSELEYLSNKTNNTVTLLLDDVFSELDSKRRAQLLNLVKNQQTIITTTDRDHVDKNILDRAKIVELGE